MKRAFATIVAGVLLMLPPGAWAQNTGATLQGLVTDAQKGVLPGVSVTITNVDTGVPRSLVTDATGG